MMAKTMPTPHRDCFWTNSYRGHYIHGCSDRKSGREIITTSVHGTREFKSYLAAQVAITKFVNHWQAA